MNLYFFISKVSEKYKNNLYTLILSSARHAAVTALLTHPASKQAETYSIISSTSFSLKSVKQKCNLYLHSPFWLIWRVNGAPQYQILWS